jgi:hypothetical protein
MGAITTNGRTMFAITSTRIVGLIAVVCAVVVAPQALAAPSAHSRIAPPDEAIQGYDLTGFDLSALNRIPGYEQQQEYLAAEAAGSHKSLKAATKAAAIKTARAAAIEALQRRSVALDALYRKLYPGAYSQAVQKSDKAAVWSFPVFCNGQANVEYDYVYSGCQG